MDFAAVYLVQRFFYRIGDFFHHWYVDASLGWGHSFISALEDLDRTFAVGITLRHFFEPLYRDYSVIGRILGVVFRSGRLLIGGAGYAVIALVFAALYLVWVAVLPVLIFYVLRHLV